MDTPKVSIITPMWNGAALVGVTIESVLAQTFTDWERTARMTGFLF